MDFEIVHNPDKLPMRKTYKVRSVRALEKEIARFMEQKQPRGLRVRYSIDVPTKRLHCEARNELALGTFLNHLREKGFLVERVAEMKTDF